MEITGVVIQVLPETGGVSKTGNNWRKKGVVIETSGQYPKKIYFEVWGEKIDSFQISAGEEITANLDVESRVYNERWYTDLKAWSVKKGNRTASSSEAPQAPAFVGPPPMPPTDEDELPF